MTCSPHLIVACDGRDSQDAATDSDSRLSDVWSPIWVAFHERVRTPRVASIDVTSGNCRASRSKRSAASDLQVERVESFGFLGPNLWHLLYFLVMAAIGIGRRPATGPAVLR